MGVDDESASRTVKKAMADHGSNVVQPGDVYGDLYVNTSRGKRVLGLLNPYGDAERLAAMPHDDAAELLASEAVPKAARVVAALLSAHNELAISLLGSIDRARAEDLLAAAGTAAAGLEQLPEAAEAIEECAAGDRRLGERIGRLRRARPSSRKTEGYYQRYRHGVVHWSERVGALVTTGAAREYYAAVKGSGGLLGFPLGYEMTATSQFFKTKGTWQRFEGRADFSPDLWERLGSQCGATLYWSSEHGAHATWGGIGEYYERAGGTWEWLGFPVSDAIEVEGPERKPNRDRTAGWLQRFEGGIIFHSDKTGSIGMSSPVAAYHQGRGDMGGTLGFPVSEEIDAETSPYGTRGRCQRFEGIGDYPADILKKWAGHVCPVGATVYRSEAFGVHSVSGGIGKVYELLEGTVGWLGFPKSDTFDASSRSISDGRAQAFEGGAILWNTRYRAVPVRADIIDTLGDLDGLLGDLGFPVAPESALVKEPETRVQRFEHGIVTARNGSCEVWLRHERSTAAAEGTDT